MQDRNTRHTGDVPHRSHAARKAQITYALATEFVCVLGYPALTGDNELNILCLQGATPLPELEGLIEINSDIPDRYNDCVILFWREKNANGYEEYLKVLRATTEPGRYYTQTRPHPGGAANLVWGHHQYKRGRHRGRPALVSASGLDRVWRDKDGDFSQDMTEKVYIGRFGIHVHTGGKGETIGRWSAGCVAIWGGYDGEPYKFFLKRVEAHPGRLIGLTLWGARDLSSWMKGRSSEFLNGCVAGRCVAGRGVTGTGWRPTLRYGIGNPWVADVQRLLNSHLDYRLVADGDWGPMTQGYFLKFQQEKGLAVDGICGTLSWAKLLCREVGMRLRENIENNDTASNEMEVVDDN